MERAKEHGSDVAGPRLESAANHNGEVSCSTGALSGHTVLTRKPGGDQDVYCANSGLGGRVQGSPRS